MRAPKLYETTRGRDMIQEFGGYNHNIRIGENEFFDMKNLTSSYYPVLSPRNKRGIVKKIGRCNGLLAKNELAYVNGNVLYYGANSMQLDATVNGERQLVSMGAYIVVFPDMMYANTTNWEDHGYFGSETVSFETEDHAKIQYNLCDQDGNDIAVTYIKTPENKAYTSQLPNMELGSAPRDMVNSGHLILVGEFTVDIPAYSVDADISFYGISFSDDSVLESAVKPEEIANCFHSGSIKIRAKKAGSATIYFSYEGEVYDSIPCLVRDFGNPTQGEYCLDLTPLPLSAPVLTQYYEDTGRWLAVDPCVKITIYNEEIVESLTSLSRFGVIQIEDQYEINGIERGSHFWKNSEKTSYEVKLIKDNSIVLAGIFNYGITDDASVYEGYLDRYSPLVSFANPAFNEGSRKCVLSLTGRVPTMDFLIESENRLWGCRYGKNAQGTFVNEIYASAQADFSKWEIYNGVSTDSYTASVGTDGPFTGAITYQGHPIFFKENCYHTVYGSYPENYQIVTETGTGVEKGSSKSLCVISGVLYYKAPDGVYRFDGASYDKISEPLGFERYSDAVGGAIDGKYYLAMTAEDSARALFVYDTTKNLWHKENGVDVAFFAPYKGDLWLCDRDETNGDTLCTVKGTQGTPEESDVEWFAETGIIGYSTPDSKYVGKFQIRLMLPVNSRVNFYVEYDSDGYMEFVGGVEGTSLRSFTLPILPRRCDHFKIRIEGVGECKIFSIAKVLEEGGEG